MATKRLVYFSVVVLKLDGEIICFNFLSSLIACVSSRPGQCGRCDGYLLEGKELEFYLKKLKMKKTK